MDREEIAAHQEERTLEMARFVLESSPFYRDHPERESISEGTFPKMDKKLMMDYFNDINTRGLEKEDLLEWVARRESSGTLDLYRGEFSVGMSSGTSGSKGLTVLSRDEMERYSCLLWARNGIPDNIRRKRVLFALRINSPAFMEVRKFGVRIVYVDYTHPVSHLVSKINSEKLNIIAGPPSLLTMISRKASKIDHDIDCVISYAEVLEEGTKKLLEDTFDAPVIQIYQGSEGFIGTTCREGNLHINEDVLKVDLEEVPRSDEDAKKVVVTDLYRRTQPILNYQLNDLIELNRTPCPCGSSFRRIGKVHGRADDIFILKGKEKRYLFPDYVRRAIMTASDDIEEYQALQHSLDEIEVRLILKEGSDIVKVRREVLSNLRARASASGGTLGEVRFTDEPPVPNPDSGKMIRVVRRYEEEGS